MILRKLTLEASIPTYVTVFTKYLKYILPYSSHLEINPDEGVIKKFSPGDTLLYDSIVNSNIHEVGYNLDIMNKFIAKNMFTIVSIPQIIELGNTSTGPGIVTLHPTILNDADTWLDLAYPVATNGKAFGYRRGNRVVFLANNVRNDSNFYLVEYDILTNVLDTKLVIPNTTLPGGVVGEDPAATLPSNPVIDSTGNIYFTLQQQNGSSLVKISPSYVITSVPEGINGFLRNRDNNDMVLKITSDDSLYLFEDASTEVGMVLEPLSLDGNTGATQIGRSYRMLACSIDTRTNQLVVLDKSYGDPGTPDGVLQASLEDAHVISNIDMMNILDGSNIYLTQDQVSLLQDYVFFANSNGFANSFGIDRTTPAFLVNYANQAVTTFSGIYLSNIPVDGTLTTGTIGEIALIVENYNSNSISDIYFLDGSVMGE